MPDKDPVPLKDPPVFAPLRPVDERENFNFGKQPKLVTLNEKGSQYDNLNRYTDPYSDAGIP